MYGASRISFSDHMRIVSAGIQQCCPCHTPPGVSCGQQLVKCVYVRGYLCLDSDPCIQDLAGGLAPLVCPPDSIVKIVILTML
jgi:hypothetical protein